MKKLFAVLSWMSVLLAGFLFGRVVLTLNAIPGLFDFLIASAGFICGIISLIGQYRLLRSERKDIIIELAWIGSIFAFLFLILFILSAI